MDIYFSEPRSGEVNKPVSQSCAELTSHTSVNTADCMNEEKFFLKYNINISIITSFKQYFPSIIQPRRVYRTCGPPKQRLVHSAHDCEIGLYPPLVIDTERDNCFSICPVSEWVWRISVLNALK